MSSSALKPIREVLIAKGIRPGTPEWKRAYNLEKWNRRSPESKKAHNKQSHIERKRRMATDPEFAAKERERNRLSKQRQRLKRREEINEQQRTCYRKSGSERKQKIYANRKKRNPHLGLASLIKAVRAGRVEPSELIAFTRSAIEQCSALIRGSQRSGLFEQRARERNGEPVRFCDRCGLQTESGSERVHQACEPIAEGQSGPVRDNRESDGEITDA